MTPRAQLQALASLMHLHGEVQYISDYAVQTASASRSGWYIVTSFRRLPSGSMVWSSGTWLGYNISMAREVIVKTRELMDKEGM